MAGVAGLSAVGTVAGVSAARALRHKEYIEDAYVGEDFALLEADRGCVVTTPDGAAGGPRGRAGDRAADGGVRARILPANGLVPLQRRPAEQWASRCGWCSTTSAVNGGPARRRCRPTPVSQLGQDLETVLQVMVPRAP